MRIALIGDSLTEGIPGCSYAARLGDRLPRDTIINLGLRNDTVVSLYRRLRRYRFDTPFDLAFVWVGVNDVVRAPWASMSWTYRLAAVLVGKPRARDTEEFRVHYQDVLDLVASHAVHIVAVSPLFKGEDLTNPWNRKLEILGRLIEGLAARDKCITYLDLRAIFAPKLAGRSISAYLPTNPLGVVLDALLLHTDAQIDRVAEARGLHYTLDGIHFNSTGAAIVAETFGRVIEAQRCS
jgi:lysophospholipase L1-like esterase